MHHLVCVKLRLQRASYSRHDSKGAQSRRFDVSRLVTRSKAEEDIKVKKISK